MENKIKIGFDYRAVVEMVNTTKGNEPIQQRLKSLFNVREYKTYNKNIKRTGGWAARAVCIGSFDLNTILRMGTSINNYDIIKEDMSWSVFDENNVPRPIIRKDCNIIQILYSSNTLTAEISIVPEFRDKVTMEYFNLHKEKLYQIFDEKIGKLASFISIIKDCKFTNKSYKDFMSNLSSIIMDLNEELLPESLAIIFTNPMERILAREYFTLNNTLCLI